MLMLVLRERSALLQIFNSCVITDLPLGFDGGFQIQIWRFLNKLFYENSEFSMVIQATAWITSPRTTPQEGKLKFIKIISNM